MQNKMGLIDISESLISIASGIASVKTLLSETAGFLDVHNWASFFTAFATD